jgi:hypothetical protein
MAYTLKAKFGPWRGTVRELRDAMQEKIYDEGGAAGEFNIDAIQDTIAEVTFTREEMDDCEIALQHTFGNWPERLRAQFLAELQDAELPAPLVDCGPVEFDDKAESLLAEFDAERIVRQLTVDDAIRQLEQIREQSHLKGDTCVVLCVKGVEYLPVVEVKLEQDQHGALALFCAPPELDFS